MAALPLLRAINGCSSTYLSSPTKRNDRQTYPVIPTKRDHGKPTLSSRPSAMIGEAGHSARGGTLRQAQGRLCCLPAASMAPANSRSLDCQDRPLRGRSSSLGMTELFIFSWRAALGRVSAQTKKGHLSVPFNYSAFCSGFEMAMVSPASPTLNRAKRRTEMFSPSLPILLAINCAIDVVWSLMKGCSYRQTSS